MITYLLYFCFLFALSPANTAHVDLYEGYWEGAIIVNSQELGIRITFSYTDGEMDGSLDIPQQQAFNLPVEVLTATADSLIFQFQTGTGVAVFRADKIENSTRIDGRFEQMGGEYPFYLVKKNLSNGVATELPEQDLVIPTDAGEIGGSLILTQNPSPLVILISGSGSQMRDENVAGFRVFGELSKQLYREGYPTFRYDDRGVGQSSGKADATLAELATDLSNVVEYFRNNYGERFPKVILAGHSQGGLVASLAAQTTAVDGIIYLASPFFSGDIIINQQIRALSAANDLSERVIEQNLAFQQRIYEVVREGSGWDEIESDLSERLELQIQQLPEKQREALGNMDSFIESQVRRQLASAKSRWFKSLIEIEPDSLVTKLEIPQLAIFGEKDKQVVADLNFDRSLQIQSESDIQLQSVIIPGANHLFQEAETGMPTEYGILEREFTDGFLQAISGWLNSLNGDL
jgi:pimeloyl-ACP methyl ester carboxylesterase